MEDLILDRINLEGANLSGVDLIGVNFKGADLRNADLSNSDLSHIILEDAILIDTNLRRADLFEANLSHAILSHADLKDTNLRYTNLSHANLAYADLRGTNLDSAYLYGATLTCAKLDGVYIPMICPEEGEFIGWKGLYYNRLAKLLIPEDAKRSSGTTRKCRCDKAKVIEIINVNECCSVAEMRSLYDPDFIYKVGEIITVANYDEDRWNECSTGIHFFMNRQEAINYMRPSYI